MAEIRWTEEAHRWLRDIFDYIAADNPEAARTVVASIYEKAQPGPVTPHQQSPTLND
jgi:plasmid stabilization system protein ParE